MYDLRTTVNPNISLSKTWGTSSSNIYFVGRNGNIAHWNGSSWKKIESGTNLDIYDIYGDYSVSTNSIEILLVAGNLFQGIEKKVLSLKNNSVKELSTKNIPDGSLHGVWFKRSKKYYVVGNGIYSKRNSNDFNNWTNLHNGLTQYYIYGIAGTNYNNIFLCGSFGETLHYNGKTWKTYRNTPGFFKNEFFNVAIKSNKVVVVGYDGSKAFIAMGN